MQPEIFDALVAAWSDLLVADYQARDRTGRGSVLPDDAWDGPQPGYWDADTDPAFIRWVKGAA